MADLHDLDALIALGSRTFFDTYASQNEPWAMEAYINQHFQPEQMTAELSDTHNHFLLALWEGEPIGYAKVRIDQFSEVPEREKAMQLERLYVLQSAQGRGLGALLLQSCFELAAKNGVDIVWLTVWIDNPKAICFYEQQGFYKAGTCVFDFAGDPQTDFLMKKQL